MIRGRCRAIAVGLAAPFLTGLMALGLCCLAMPEAGARHACCDEGGVSVEAAAASCCVSAAPAAPARLDAALLQAPLPGAAALLPPEPRRPSTLAHARLLRPTTRPPTVLRI
jgi:hypothetical protein